MLQEILTYIIVGGAIIWAITKIIKRFRKRKKMAQSCNQTEEITMLHNCSECGADNCSLRDLPKRVIIKNIERCTKTAVPLSKRL